MNKTDQQSPAPASEKAADVTAADFAISERLPLWQRMLLDRAPKDTPNTQEGWAKALAKLLAERI